MTMRFTQRISGALPIVAALLAAGSAIPVRADLAEHETKVSSEQDASQRPVEDDANRAVVNGGLETGDFTGWTSAGATDVVGAAFGIAPPTGEYQAFLKSGGADAPMMTLSEFVGSDVDQSPTEPKVSSAMRQTIRVQAGDVLTFVWRLAADPAIEGASLGAAYWSLVDQANGVVIFEQLTGETEHARTVVDEETGFAASSFTFAQGGRYALSFAKLAETEESAGQLSALLVDDIQIKRNVFAAADESPETEPNTAMPLTAGLGAPVTGGANSFGGVGLGGAGSFGTSNAGGAGGAGGSRGGGGGAGGGGAGAGGGAGFFPPIGNDLGPVAVRPPLFDIIDSPSGTGDPPPYWEPPTQNDDFDTPPSSPILDGEDGSDNSDPPSNDTGGPGGNPPSDSDMVELVPEPSAIYLWCAGFLGLGLWRYRRQGAD